MDDLFSSPVLRVEQPRKVLATQAQYTIYGQDGEPLANAAESDSRSRLRALRAALPGGPATGAQTLLVSSADDVPLLILDKDADGRRTAIRSPRDEPIGVIRADRTTRHYSLLDPDGKVIGEITGDLALRKFAVNDASRAQVARISKKWAGLAAEMLTTADRYAVEITGTADGPLRTMVVMSAIVLDLTLHESKDVV